MARRTKAEAEETRLTILEAAQREFFRRGVTKTSLNHIAKAAKVSRGAIYWHFKNKQDVFEAMSSQHHLPLENLANEVLATEGKLALQRLKDHLVGFLQKASSDQQHREFFEVVLLKCEFNQDNISLLERQQKVLQQSSRHLVQILEAAVSAGDLPADLNVKKSVLLLQSSLIGLLYRWLVAPQQFDLYGYAEDYIAALLQAISSSANLEKATD